jgi:hypothetical protein
VAKPQNGSCLFTVDSRVVAGRTTRSLSDASRSVFSASGRKTAFAGSWAGIASCKFKFTTSGLSDKWIAGPDRNVPIGIPGYWPVYRDLPGTIDYTICEISNLRNPTSLKQHAFTYAGPPSGLVDLKPRTCIWVIAEFTDLLRGFPDSSIVRENVRAGPSSGHLCSGEIKPW